MVHWRIMTGLWNINDRRGDCYDRTECIMIIMVHRDSKWDNEMGQ